MKQVKKLAGIFLCTALAVLCFAMPVFADGVGTFKTVTTYAELVDFLNNATYDKYTRLTIKPADDFGWPETAEVTIPAGSNFHINLQGDWEVPTGVTLTVNNANFCNYNLSENITVKGTVIVGYRNLVNPVSYIVDNGGVLQVAAGISDGAIIPSDTTWTVKGGGKIDVDGHLIIAGGVLELEDGAVVESGTNLWNTIEIDPNGALISNGGTINGGVRAGGYQGGEQTAYIGGTSLAVDTLVFGYNYEIEIRGNVTADRVSTSRVVVTSGGSLTTGNVSAQADITVQKGGILNFAGANGGASIVSQIWGKVVLEEGAVAAVPEHATSVEFVTFDETGTISGAGTLQLYKNVGIDLISREKISCAVNDNGHHINTAGYDCIWCKTGGKTDETDSDIKVIANGDKVKDSVSGATVTVLSTTKKTVVYTAPAKKTATTVSVPATVKINGTGYKVTSIAEDAFASNKKLKTITIGSNVTSIGKNAFKGCTALTTVKGGANVTKIGTTAFYGCVKLTTVKGMAKVSTIGTKAFANCRVLKTIGSTTSVITLPKVKTVGTSAFINCAKITTVNFSSTLLTSIGGTAFQNCKALKSVTIKSQKLKTVGSKAFYKAKSGCTFKITKKATTTQYKKYQTLIKKAKASNPKFKKV